MVSYGKEDDMSNFWNQQDQDLVSEYDMLEAQDVADIAEEYASQPIVVEATEEELEEVAEESAYALDRQESNTIYNTKLRLEQARLYDLLINHDLFEGVEADPNAIAIVQNELKHYIVRRLEILMGLRQPKPKQVETSSSGLNEVEIDFLKQLAYKGTMGKSVQTSAPQEKPRSPIAPAPKKQGLNSLSTKPQLKKPASPAPQKKPAAVQKTEAPTPTKQEKPKKNIDPADARAKKVQTKPSGMGRTLTMEEAMEIAKADLEATKGKKSWNEMSKKEKKAEMERVNARHKKTKIANNVPFPTADQLEMQYMTQMQRRGATDQTQQFNLMLANALASQKNNQ